MFCSVPLFFRSNTILWTTFVQEGLVVGKLMAYWEKIRFYNGVLLSLTFLTRATRNLLKQNLEFDFMKVVCINPDVII